MPRKAHKNKRYIALRIVSIGSASEDFWANPRAEMLCAKSASQA